MAKGGSEPNPSPTPYPVTRLPPTPNPHLGGGEEAEVDRLAGTAHLGLVRLGLARLVAVHAEVARLVRDGLGIGKGEG